MITVPIDAGLLRGVAELETTPRGVRPHRLPAAVRSRYPDPQLLMVEQQPSGARLVFRTSAQVVELVTHPSRVGYRGADRPRGCLDLVVDGEDAGSSPLEGGDLLEVDLQTGASEFLPGPSHTTSWRQLRAGDKLVEIWLPHNEALELVEVRTDQPIHPVPAEQPRWLHHGSSISHGSNAGRPTEIWPVVAARRAGVDLVNLGLGGSALVDPFTARVLRDTPADVISVKLGINVVNLDAMRLRAFVPAVHGFLDTIRDGHPETPLVLVSPIFCAIHEDTPGPGALDPASLGTGQVRFTATGRAGDHEQGRLTLRVIREALSSLAERRADDPNLHHLDGTSLYGEADAVDHPLPDALHPDTATHRLIGERFADHAFGAGGPFAAVRHPAGG
jgi:hypothetical protein